MHWLELERESQRLFQEVVGRPADERARILDRCQSDDVRTTIDELLRSHDAAIAAGFLGVPLFEPRENEAFAGPGDAWPRQLANYRLLGKIGQGGSSRVYLAERVDRDWSQRVAIKVLRAGFDGWGRQIADEARILSTLEHPAIARLLDSGTTDDGLPFLVMEYVEGEPVTSYCDRHRLDLDKRLELFAAVCAAVQYAHQSLVVHRDLKPANILVTSDGSPKLLDFGIAKLLMPGTGDSTAADTRVLTPNYASPEHLSGGRITTASDTYSLGVLLYELLAGRRPHDWGDRPYFEVLAGLPHYRPEPASRSVRSNPERRAVATARRIGDEALARRLAGDLDSILLRALAFEPESRYASAEQLAEDLGRYRDGLPVSAREASVSYRLRKFARRHRVALANATAVLVLTVTGAVAAIVQWQRAEQERAAAEIARQQAEIEQGRASQVSTFLVELFGALDPTGGQGSTMSTGELLAIGRTRALELENQPELRVSLLTAIGASYHGLALYEDARASLEWALEEIDGFSGDASRPQVEALLAYGKVLRDTGELEAADERLRSALRIAEGRLGSDPPTVALCLRLIASVSLLQGELGAAESEAQRSVVISRGGGPSALSELSESLSVLGAVELELGRHEEALATFEEALSISRKVARSPHHLIASRLNDLALALQQSGRQEAAERIMLDAIREDEANLGPDHPALAVGLANLSLILLDRSAATKAESAARRAFEIQARQFGDGHHLVVDSGNNLALALIEQGRYDDAISLLRALAGDRLELAGENDTRRATVVHNLALAQMYAGEAESAERAFRVALDIRARTLGERHPLTLRTLVSLANVVRDRNGTEAEVYYVRALSIARSLHGEDHVDTARIRGGLAKIYIDSGRHAEALPLARSVAEIYEKAYSATHWRTAVARARLGAALAGLRQFDEAFELLRSSHRTLAEAPGVGAAYLPWVENKIRLAAAARGDDPEAVLADLRRPASGNS